MIIKKLEIEGFKIIGDPIKVEFSENGRTAISGRNETGKSTLLDSIEFALYGLKQGQGSSREDIITWGKEKAKVAIQFTVSQQEYLLQREVRKGGGHNVKLLPIVNGSIDRSNALTNIRQVDEKIEELHGLDRHAFSKLIYIKQKDLDALKDLAKAGREQLLNKVMGIEVFDQAIENVKSDIKLLESELVLKESEIIRVRRNKEAYEKSLSEEASLLEKIANNSPKLESLKSNLQEMRGILEVYEWSLQFNSLNELAKTDQKILQEVQREQTILSDKKEALSRYKVAIEKYQPQIRQLQEILTRYQETESENQRAESNFASLVEKQRQAVGGGQYSPKEKVLLSKDLTKEKQKQLKRFAVCLVIGLGLVTVAIIINLLITIAGIALIMISVIAMKDYQRADKLFAKSADIKSISSQIEEARKEKQQSLEKSADLRTQHAFQSSDELLTHVSEILAIIRQETGTNSVEGLQAVAENLESEINRIMLDDPAVRLNDLVRSIENREQAIEALLKSKPDKTDMLPYNEEQFKSMKLEHQLLVEDYNNLYGQVSESKALLRRVQQDLIAFKPDYDNYPQVEKQILETKRKNFLLERVEDELSETSKELRNKVIPSARFFINRILPLLTSGRYSDFEITDDLKFKVHSIQAGDYKQREIFSGGTQDQFLIALRLAFTQSILNSRISDDRYCLLMDESISSSDDLRKQGIFEVLDVMKDTFPQIVIIAHEDISSFVDHNIMLSRNDNGFTELKSDV